MYNFEATFIQPLISQVDLGTLKNSEDWAHAVTNAYITTIMAGMPLGIPPTLPAPAQLGVPFAIMPSGFTTARARSKSMYTIIHAYFYAKELKINKLGITAIINTIKFLHTKIKSTYVKVKNTIELIAMVTKKIADLDIPQIYVDIKKGIKDLVVSIINNVKEAVDSLSTIKMTLPPNTFKQMFAKELSIVETIKNFNITDLQSLQEIQLFIADYVNQAKAFIKKNSSDPVAAAKDYLKKRIYAAAIVLLNLANSASDPSKFLTVIQPLINKVESLQSLYYRLKQFDWFKRYLEPWLKRLNNKKKDLMSSIKNYIQPKIVGIYKDMEARIAAFFAKSGDNRSVAVFKKANKKIKQQRVRNEVLINLQKKRIKQLIAAGKLAADIALKSLNLTTAITAEFKSVKADIEMHIKMLKESVTKEKLSNAEALELGKKGMTDAAARYQPDESSKKLHLEDITNYMQAAGLGDYVSLAHEIIVSTGCTPDLFKKYFNTAKRDYVVYKKSIKDLIVEVKELLNVVHEIKETNVAAGIARSDGGRKREKKSKTPKVVEKEYTLLELLKSLVTWLKPYVKKMVDWISKMIKKSVAFLENKLLKFKEDLSEFAKTLLPVDSNVADKERKADALKAKIAKKKDQIDDVKRTVKQAQHIVGLGVASGQLFQNIIKGNYYFSDNKKPLTDIHDDYWGYKLAKYFDEPVNAAGHRPITDDLQKRKELSGKSWKTHTDTLLLIELLAKALFETIKDMAEDKPDGSFKKAWNEKKKDFAKNAKTSAKNDLAIISLSRLTSNPPKTLNDLITVANSLSSDVLRGSELESFLKYTEVKYLNKSRAIIKTMIAAQLQVEKVAAGEADTSDPADTKRSKWMDGKARVIVNAIEEALLKDRSFIVIAFDYLRKLINWFKAFMKIQISKMIKRVKESFDEKRKKREDKLKKDIEDDIKKRVNIDAPIISFMFALAGRAFWTGATWVGTTGTVHTTFNVGPFVPMKVIAADGASVLIREMARGFRNQLAGLQGIASPIPATGIPPIPFVGYL